MTSATGASRSATRPSPWRRWSQPWLRSCCSAGRVTAATPKSSREAVGRCRARCDRVARLRLRYRRLWRPVPGIVVAVALPVTDHVDVADHVDVELVLV